MSELIWFNGRIIPFEEARIHPEDRGYQYADGVYEVVRVYNGKIFALKEHMERLDRSAKAIALDFESARVGEGGMGAEFYKLLEKTGFKEARIYAQVTRGVAPRNHNFPKNIVPVVLFYARPVPPLQQAMPQGLRVQEVKDERWHKCWIKSVALLANVLAKNEAMAAGADEAVLIDQEIVTECSAANIFAVIDGKLVTHPWGEKVLPGITRMVLIELAREMKVPVVERPWTRQEAAGAQEIFLSGTTHEVEWVQYWNGKKIANQPGELTLRMRRAMIERIRRDTR